MKQIGKYKINNESLAASYCGAFCAGHIAEIGNATEDYIDDFSYLYNRNINKMMAIVKELPNKMSILGVIKDSPANLWTDMYNDWTNNCNN
jgi:hypothetical protein